MAKTVVKDASYDINAKVRRRNQINSAIRYIVLIVVGIFMVYPLVWMIGATFKPNNEIFAGLNIFPMHPTLEGYQNAVKSYGGNINIWKALINTFTIVIPKVIFTVPGLIERPLLFSKISLLPEMATGTTGAFARWAIFRLPPLNSPRSPSWWRVPSGKMNMG